MSNRPFADSSPRFPASPLGAVLLGVVILVPAIRSQEDAAVAPAKEALRISVQPGQETYFKVAVDRLQVVDMGQKMSMVTDVQWVISATPQKPAEDGDAEQPMVVVFRIAAAHGALEMPMMGETRFDTRKDGDSASGVPAAMASLVGMEFRASVGPSGKVEVTDDHSERFEQALTVAGGTAAQLLAGVINPGLLPQLAGSVFPKLPEEPKAVGDTWAFTPPVDVDSGPVVFKLDLTLKGLAADEARFEGEGTVELLEEAEMPEGMDPEAADMMRDMIDGMEIKNGANSMTMVWSRKDGMVKESRQETRFDLETEGPMGPMKIDNKETVTVSRGTAADAKGGDDAKDSGGSDKDK